MKLLTVVSTECVMLIECEATKFQTCSKRRLLITLNLGIIYLLWNIDRAKLSLKLANESFSRLQSLKHNSFYQTNGALITLYTVEFGH